MIFAILAAMESEAETLISDYSATEDKYGYYTAEKDGNRIIIASSGVGKVNAAAAAQRLTDLYSPDIIINTGIAGGLAQGLELGDIILSEDAVYHDFHPIEIFDRYPPYSVKFTADRTLLELAAHICTDNGYRFYTGTIASGDCFVNSSQQKADIINRTNALCTEMEGAAVAHICLLNKIKFLIVRSVSDFADDDAQIVNEFEKTAARRAAAIVHGIITDLTLGVKK